MTLGSVVGRDQRRARFLALLTGCTAVGATTSVARPARAQGPIRLVVQAGETPPGAPAPVSTLGPPFINGTGKVGFTGSLEDGDRFVWYGDGIRWRNRSGSGLSGAETWMGTSDGAGFIYSPAVNGRDAVYTHGGALLMEGDRAPGRPGGTAITFNSRPSMLPGGRVYWVAGINETGGTTTQKRVLYTSVDANPAAIEPLLVGGDRVGGLVVADQGVLFDYRFSDDGAHHIHELDVIAPSTSDGALMVNGQIVAREGFRVPHRREELWSTFDQLDINNAGNYVFSGDTNGDPAKDEFVAYNGAIAVHESQTVAAVTLEPGATANAVHINNLGQVVMMWDVGDVETVFLSCEAEAIARTASIVLTTGRGLDFNGDGTTDAVVTDFNASAGTPHEAFSDDGRLYLEVDLDYGDGNTVEAIIELQLTCCGNGVVNSYEECDDAGESTTCDADCTAAARWP